MQDINSSDSITPIPRPSDNNDKSHAMPQSRSFDVEKSIGELSKSGRRPSIVEVFADPTDELDPQNWKPWKKRLVFVALMSSSILCDGGMTWGATLVVPQAIEWKTSITHSATSLNYGILLQGFGGIIAVPMMDAFGRLPLWFYPQVATLFVVLGCCFAETWSVFTALRALQGLFGTIPQVIGLPIIHDMYAPKDWPRMINIWSTTFLIGPFLGPALAGYIMEGTKSWRAVFGVLTGLYGLSTILVILFARETYYHHANRVQQTNRPKAFLAIGNTNLPKLATIASSTKQIIKLIFTTPLLLVGISTMINFTWPIGITTTIDPVIHAPPYLMNNINAASMRFAGVIGALLGFVFGYFFNEWIYHGSNGERKVHWRSEYRLHGIWFPVASMVCGLLCYGLTLQYQALWVGLACGWVLVNIGLVGSTVAVTAFALEKYPEHASVIAAILNMWRVCGGFAVGYFQPSWIAKNGAAAVYATQAAIVAVCVVVLITPVILMGRKEEIKREEMERRASLDSA